MANENEKTNEVEDIRVENDLGRQKMSVRVGNGSDDIVALPTAVWNYGAIVNALVRSKYSEDKVEAIVSNALMLMATPSMVSDDEASEKQAEFSEFTEWREKCKARAKALLALGATIGLDEM